MPAMPFPHCDEAGVSGFRLEAAAEDGFRRLVLERTHVDGAGGRARSERSPSLATTPYSGQRRRAAAAFAA